MMRPHRRVFAMMAVGLAAIASAGCEDSASRHAVPAALAGDAKIPGYEGIRFWGDEDTPDFEAAMKRQYTDLKAAARSGAMPNADRISQVLAISGGGDQGPFAAGYLTGWSESGSRPMFDTVTGVSTGALTAPFAFLGEPHDHDLKQIYTDTSADQLYDARWDFGVLSNAVKDTKPLREMIERFANDAFLDAIAAQYRIGRRLLVSTTDLDNQRPVIWDLSAIAASGRSDRRQLFVDILLASSAVPGIFPPVKFHVTTPDGHSYDELHVDGSVSMQVFFLPPGIKLAETEQEVFGHTRDRTLYALRNGKLAPEFAATADKAADLLQRGVATLVKYQVVYNLRLLEKNAEDSRTRFKFMGIPISFDEVPKGRFDKDYAEGLFEAGRIAGSRGEWLDKVPESPELAKKESQALQRVSR